MSDWRHAVADPPPLNDADWRLESDWLLVYDEHGNMMVARLCAYHDDEPDEARWIQFGRDGYECSPLFWQPLPEAPYA